jgi:hypothetical protein
MAIAITSNIGFQPLSRADRERIALYLYGERQWSQQAIARALGAGQATVSRLLREATLSTVNNVRYDSLGRHASSGRPRGLVQEETSSTDDPAAAKRAREQAEREAQELRERLKQEEEARQAAEQTAREAEERLKRAAQEEQARWQRQEEEREKRRAQREARKERVFEEFFQRARASRQGKPISDKDRQRIAQLLGMLGSSADGEALNAARLAEKARIRLGVTWFELLNVTAQ